MSMRLNKLVIMDISLTCLRSRRSSYGCHLPSLRLKVLISSSSGVLSTGENGIVHAMYLMMVLIEANPRTLLLAASLVFY